MWTDTTIPFIIIEISPEPIFLAKCEVLGFLGRTNIEICEIMTSSALEALRWPVFISCVMGAICRSDVRIRYGIDTTLLLNVMVCDLYFNSHILL